MTQQDLDLSILDMNMDEIEDLPGFEVPYPGEYDLKMSAALKEVNDKKCVEIGYEVVQCIKKNNDADPDSIPGSKFSQLFFLEGDADSVKVSLGMLKALIAPIAEAVGQGNLLILIRDHLDGAMVSATVGRRKDKNDPERFYPKVSNLKLQG